MVFAGSGQILQLCTVEIAKQCHVRFTAFPDLIRDLLAGSVKGALERCCFLRRDRCPDFILADIDIFAEFDGPAAEIIAAVDQLREAPQFARRL